MKSGGWNTTGGFGQSMWNTMNSMKNTTQQFIDAEKQRKALVEKREKANAEANNIAAAPQSTPYTYNRTPYSYAKYQYTTPELSQNIKPAYEQARQNLVTGSKAAIRSGVEDAVGATGRRGVARGGIGEMATNQAIGFGQRNLLNELSGLGLQEARDLSQIEQTQAGMEMTTQAKQAEENRLAEQLANVDRQMDYEEWTTGRQIDQAERELRRNEVLSQFQMDTALRNEQWQREMTPIQLLMQLFGYNAGQQATGSAGTPGVFGNIAGLAGGLGSVFAGLCLPKGTQIECDDGSIAVEELKPGMKVKGGDIISTVIVLRPPWHNFYRHKFETGDVVMSAGHPSDDKLISTDIVSHDSRCTYDILTSDGYYYVNGVKLRSTLGR